MRSAEGTAPFRSGHIAIAGAPNVGKSTLLNTLIGQKISIVSPRPQTTRRNVIGILTTETFQAILVDTPGLLEPSYRLHKAMQHHAMSGIQGSEVLLVLIDAPRADAADPAGQIIPALRAAADGPQVIVALNKIDRLPRTALLPILERIARLGDFHALVPISALNGDGVGALIQELAGALPEGPMLYPGDQITDQPEHFAIAERVREAIFHRFSQEIPYATVCLVEEMARRGPKRYIRVVVYAERASQKAILLGRGGSAIREVGQAARREIEHLLGEPVYLDIWVKVREQWRDREDRLRDFELL